MLCKHNWLLLEARLEKSVHLWHGLIALYILGPAPCMVVEAMGTITFAARRTLDGVLNSIVVHKSRELEGLRGELEAARELRGAGGGRQFGRSTGEARGRAGSAHAVPGAAGASFSFCRFCCHGHCRHGLDLRAASCAYCKAGASCGMTWPRQEILSGCTGYHWIVSFLA